MTSPANLERMTHKFDQAYAMIAFSQSATLLVAVRVLLGQIRSDDMLTRATQAQWMHVEETMLRLRSGAVASDEIRGLGLEIHHLRGSIVQYLSRISY
jgi:hypothetical protein